jgi:GAF domain-containing protein
MDAVHKGGLSQRAAIITSDETAQLTIRLNQLLDELEMSQHALEKQVAERTADLTRRTLQLQAAAQVAHDASLQTNIYALLSQAVELISDRFGYYHAGIFLVDEAREYAVLQAASSEGGKQMIARGHRLAVGQQGIVGATAYQNRPHVAMDVGADAVYARPVELPQTNSEAAIPLSARGAVIGVLDIQSTEKSAFSQEDIELLQTMADQIALAIQNTRLISESQDAIQKLEAATAEDVRQIWKNRISGAKRSYRYTALGLTTPTGKQAAEARPNQMTLPITLRGQRIGTITVNRKEEAGWGEADRSLAIEVANQIGLALENARLLDDAQRHAAQEQSLSELTAHLSRSLDSDTILQTVVRELRQLPTVEEVSVFLAPATRPEPPKETL